MARRARVPLTIAICLLCAACAPKATPNAAGQYGGLPLAGGSATPAPSNAITVKLGETDPNHMFINLSGTVSNAGKVSFFVTNSGTRTHEFVVLKTNTPAANFPIGRFEGEDDRINEDTVGTNVGETGDMKAGETKTLSIVLQPGHYALVCNLPGHYRMGMHQDFTVLPPPNTILATLGTTNPQQMFIDLSGTSARAGKVTFVVSNPDTRTHEFVVLKTNTPAANFPIGTFEGENDRINEDTAGTNVGETGDMKPGTTKTLVIAMTAGHYAIVCNLPGHYRMGMHQDFTVLPPPNTILATLGTTNPQQMFINLSAATATAGKVTFVVSNPDTRTHEFVVLKTNTPAANFPIGTFEGENDRINEDTAGTNVGETGDMKPGSTKTLVIDMAAGHYAIVCNLPGHYRMGMHQDFTVAPAPNTIVVTEGEHGPNSMFIDLSSTSARAGRVTFDVTNSGTRTHEFVVLKTNTPAANFPIGRFEGENDRINEDTVGTNVGETGDMKVKATKSLVITLGAGHYALVCNLPGHYRMGMHRDFTVT